MDAADRPLVAVVSRLTAQKGVQLLKQACWTTLQSGGQFVLIGTAPEPHVQAEFNALAEEIGKKHPSDGRLVFAFDETLARLLYAAADLVLVRLAPPPLLLPDVATRRCCFSPPLFFPLRPARRCPPSSSRAA